jgi:branched-chain amino acid aminotransferase
MTRSVTWSQTVSFFENDWHKGNVPIMGVRTHAAGCARRCSMARAPSKVLLRMSISIACASTNPPSLWASSPSFRLKPESVWSTRDESASITVQSFTSAHVLARGRRLRCRPAGSRNHTLVPLALRLASAKADGYGAHASPFRRPTRVSAPVEAKAGCLYPNNARAMTEARGRGFDNCLMCDMLGNVAELATANIFMAKDGVVITPVPNGTFLSGITRARVIALLREAGVDVVETTLRYSDFQSADEIFSSGNYTKVAPITRIDKRNLQPGPIYRRARELYWEFAHTTP